MNGFKLATALARLADQKPGFEQSLSECLGKFVKSNLLKSPTFEQLQAVHNVAGPEFSHWLINQPTDAELDKLIKKFDRHGLPASSPQSEKKQHLLKLMSGAINPKQKMGEGGGKTKQQAMDPEAILKLPDRERRRAELQKLSVTQLKTAINDLKIDGGSLSKKPSKSELVEHIQAALDAGWPSRVSTLAGSRY